MTTARPASAGPMFDPDPVFMLDASVALRVPARFDVESTLRKLELKISRDPQDLLSHVRRILILTDVAAPEPLFAALVDLNLALGNRATELRSLMLSLASPHLPSDEQAYLEQILPDGLRRHQRLPITAGSRLSPGLIGSPVMVREHARVAAPEPQRGSAVEQAQLLLEDGDIEAARMLLEDALVAQPDQQDVLQELYEIHRRLRNRAAVLSLNDRLKSRGASLPGDWAHLLADH